MVVQFDGKQPKLITSEVFQRVQEVLEAHRTSGERSYRRKHYMAGTLFCDRCESRLIFGIATGRGGGRYAYWFCNGRVSYKNGCDLPSLPAEIVEEKVIGQRQIERLSETSHLHSGQPAGRHNRAHQRD